MIDNEIIKALEQCSSSIGAEACKRCPFDEKNICDTEDNAPQKYALDLINRQKEEIERYKGVIKRLEDGVRLAKIEIVKEFGKLLIDKIDNGVITHSFDIVDLVADEVERIEKGR